MLWGRHEAFSFFCDSRVIQLLDVLESRFSLSYKFKNCQDDLTWFFTGIYGPTNDEYIREMWEDLGAIKGLWREPWCIRGDFNMIRFPD